MNPCHIVLRLHENKSAYCLNLLCISALLLLRAKKLCKVKRKRVNIEIFIMDFLFTFFFLSPAGSIWNPKQRYLRSQFADVLSNENVQRTPVDLKSVWGTKDGFGMRSLSFVNGKPLFIKTSISDLKELGRRWAETKLWRLYDLLLWTSRC
jgi:hypothetical protein